MYRYLRDMFQISKILAFNSHIDVSTQFIKRNECIRSDVAVERHLGEVGPAKDEGEEREEPAECTVSRDSNQKARSVNIMLTLSP